MPTRQRTVLWAAVAVVLAGASLAPVSPATARAKDGIKVTGDHPVMEKTYSALIGQAANTGTAATNWYTCSTAHTYCDTIRVDIDPQGLTFYVVTATLSWPNPRTQQNPQGNDLNIAIWEPDEVTVYCCRNSRTTNTTTHPEQAVITTDNPDPSTFTLIVDNTAGVNAGYTVKVEIHKLDRLGADAFKRALEQSGAATTTTTSRTTRATKPTDESPRLELDLSAPDPTPRVVKVPGPDGEPVEIELPVLAAGARQRVETQRFSPLTAALVAIAIVAFGGGAVYVALRRRRLRAS